MTARLNVEPAIERPDDFYEALIAAHRGLSDEQSVQLNCRLVLLLANHVGDHGVLGEALARAREGLGSDEGAPGAPSTSGPARPAAGPAR
jgi:hypothetical protein